jgi:carboxyl-terminal processing protease
MDTLASWVSEGAPDENVERYIGLWFPISARARLAGAEGSEVTVHLRDGSNEERSLTLERAAPRGEEVRLGNLPPLRMESTHRIERLPGGGEAGVIRLSAWFPAIVPALATAMGDLREVDGIVLDLRGNPGGLAALVMGVGGHFLDEPLSLGEMRMREATLRFVVNPQRVTEDGTRVEPFGGPFAILVDPLTASTSEVFAGGMQALGRARVFGETTAGQALPALVTALPNGDRLLHAVADFTAADGSRLEGAGVTPDVIVPLTREALLAGEDSALREAFQWIASHPD